MSLYLKNFYLKKNNFEFKIIFCINLNLLILMNREDDMEYEGDFMNEEYNEYEDFNEQDEEEEKKCNEKNSIFFIEGLDGHIISETEATIKYESLI